MIKRKKMLGLAVPYPKLFWEYRYMYWDQEFNKKYWRAHRQTDRPTKVMALFICFSMSNNETEL